MSVDLNEFDKNQLEELAFQMQACVDNNNHHHMNYWAMRIREVFAAKARVAPIEQLQQTRIHRVNANHISTLIDPK